MRFMMLMIPKDYAAADADVRPSAEAVAEMMKFNAALSEAGALIALDGLHPPATGARISFEGGKPSVALGPFPDAKEMLGGYWMIDVASRDEAIAWASKCPAADGDMIEIRQVFEMTDFPADVQSTVEGAGLKTVSDQVQGRARK